MYVGQIICEFVLDRKTDFSSSHLLCSITIRLSSIHNYAYSCAKSRTLRINGMQTVGQRLEYILLVLFRPTFRPESSKMSFCFLLFLSVLDFFFSLSRTGLLYNFVRYFFRLFIYLRRSYVT